MTDIFWKSFFELALQILSETFLILRRIQRDIVISVYWSSCKFPIIIVRFEWNLNFLDRFSKNIQILNFVKIRPVEAELFQEEGQTDRQTDMTEVIVIFDNFVYVPENCSQYAHYLVKSQTLSKLLWACPALICIHLGRKLYKIRENFDLRCYLKNGLRCTACH